MDLIYREEDFKDIFLVAMSVVSDNKIIGLQYNAKRLYEMDLTTDKIKYLTEIPIDRDDEFKLYQKSVVYNNKIYFLPFNCSKMAILDLKSLEFEMIDIPTLDTKEGARIINVYVDENTLLMIPYQGGKFVRFDMRTHQVLTCYDFADTIGSDLLCSYTICEDGVLLLPSMTSNKIFSVNFNEENISYIQLAEDGDTFSGITIFENNIWAVLKNRFGVLKYNIKTKECCLNDNCPEWFCLSGNTCFDSKNVFNINQKLVCMPAFANTAVEIDLRSERIEEIIELRKYCENASKDVSRFIFDGNCAMGDTRYLCYQEIGIVEIDLITKKTILHKFNKNTVEDCLKFLMEKM